GALNAEMGLQTQDPDLAAARAGGRVTTPSGMTLDGSQDEIDALPTLVDGKKNLISTSLVDFLEFYLLNYFKPATYQQTDSTRLGRRLLDKVACTTCHITNLQLRYDRRVADVETVYNPERGIFNNLFATAMPLYDS